jgi:hypothetical protein
VNPVEVVVRKGMYAAVVGLLVAGCASTGQGQAGDQTRSEVPASGILVRTLISPGCPIAPAGDRCPTRPIAATVTVTTAGSRTVAATVDSGADGRLTVHLDPGRYTVTSRLDRAGAPREHRSATVTVTTRGYTHLTVRFPSRIDGRLPS